MERDGVRAHWVRHNKVTRVPRAHIYLDTEATSTGDDAGSVQSFRLGVTAFDRKYHHADRWAPREWADHTDAASVWAWVDARAAKKARTVLVAHNLAYDLRLSDAFHQLPALGWELKAIRLDAGQAWCTWRQAQRTLQCVDTLSWVNASLERVGVAVGIPKLDLPAWEADNDAWFARCRRDVEILAELWRRIIAFVVTEDLGNWKPTGAGQSWAAYRHRFMSHPLLVHEDTDARQAERAAAHTGRCEVWRHGELRNGPYTEWDATAAYARIGWGCDVPTKLHGELYAITDADLIEVARKQAVLAEVEVTTDVPVVPVRTDDGITWPTGTFTTRLWDCEMDLVRGVLGTVKPRRAWWYRRVPALHDFCGWVLSLIDETRTDVDPVHRMVAKHWSRSLIGRMATRYSTWDTWGRSPAFDVSLSRLVDSSDVEGRRLLQVGHQLLRSGPPQEGADSMVAIMSWIMARARVDLWNVMSAAGLEHVVYVDTDSVIVDVAGDRALADAALPGLRVKGRYRRLHVMAPRQLVREGRLSASGVPSSAVPVDTDVWRADVWTGLGRSLSEGEPASVSIRSRLFRLSGVDRRRLHLPGGRTAPVEFPAE